MRSLSRSLVGLAAVMVSFAASTNKAGSLDGRAGSVLEERGRIRPMNRRYAHLSRCVVVALGVDEIANENGNQ